MRLIFLALILCAARADFPTMDSSYEPHSLATSYGGGGGDGGGSVAGFSVLRSAAACVLVHSIFNENAVCLPQNPNFFLASQGRTVTREGRTAIRN